MANYFVLQKNDESTAYAFKVAFTGFRPYHEKPQREQYTTTGKLDITVGVSHNVYSYTVKLFQEETGSFSSTPGSIMTASTVYWGDLSDLQALFNEDTPPDNKYRFRDVDGNESYVFFSNKIERKQLTPVVTGEAAYSLVDILLRGTSS